jgi:hypothetical protein
LEDLGIAFELTVVSAHRTPKRMIDYAESARERGIKVIIAGAGGAARRGRPSTRAWGATACRTAARRGTPAARAAGDCRAPQRTPANQLRSGALAPKMTSTTLLLRKPVMC